MVNEGSEQFLARLGERCEFGDVNTRAGFRKENTGFGV